jgi:hypothetical protein
MVNITLSAIVPSTIPTEGWKVGYRIKGTTGAYIVPVGSPFMSSPITFTTTDAVGTLYEGYIRRDCGAIESTDYFWVTACNCTGSGYSVTPAGTGCFKIESIPAIVTNSGFCLAPSTNSVYSSYGSRIYNVGFDNIDIMSDPSTVDPSIYGVLTTTPQWANPLSSTTVGPMNREGVWIDNNCDGVRDALIVSSGTLVVGAGYTIYNILGSDDFTNVGAGSNTNGTQFIATGTTPANWTNGSTLGIQKTTIAFTYTNTGAARQVFVGVGGDNQFKIVVNGTVVADTGTISGDKQFKLWHLLPVTLNGGDNFFNVIALGDGSSSDSIAMVVYDNTALQLSAATADSQLSILYKTSNLRGTTYDVATCPDGYNLDTSGGSGTYTCKRTLTKSCNTLT